MRVPAEALQPAFAPAIVASQGVDLAGRPALNVQAFPGAVTLLDYIVASTPFVFQGLNIEQFEELTDEQLDRAMRQRWRFAAALLRTRPRPKPDEPPNRLSLVNGGGDS